MIYFIVSLLLIYLVANLLLAVFQEQFIFFPTKLSPNYRFIQFENAEEVTLSVSKEVSLHALHFKVPDSKGVILYFHGNSQGLESWGFEAAPFTKLGFDVVMPDYRTFGKSTGKLTAGVLHQDADRWYDYVAPLYDSDKIVLYGRSLGSGVACALATRQPARLAILETPYFSILSLAQRQMWFVPVKLFLRYPLRSDLYIKQVKCPVHLFHGTEDELIPYQQAVDLANAYGDPNILTTIEGGTHGNLGTFRLFKEQLATLLLK